VGRSSRHRRRPPETGGGTEAEPGVVSRLADKCSATGDRGNSFGRDRKVCYEASPCRNGLVGKLPVGTIKTASVFGWCVWISTNSFGLRGKIIIHSHPRQYVQFSSTPLV
jgi:hypothetical protein